MKIGAHPLVVAVALGMLSPGALAEEELEIEPRLSAHKRLDEPVDRLLTEAQPVGDDAYARVAAQWYEARDLI